MALQNTFREVAIGLSPKQPQMVDYLLEDAPIMEMMPFYPTTQGMSHVYEELVDVTGNGLVELDSPLPFVNANTKIAQANLEVIGGLLEVGEDKAKLMGGAGNYFAGKVPKVLKKTGQDSERAVLYNNLRAAAIAAQANPGLVGNEDHLLSAGGNAGTNYSIIAVKWEEGMINGLYNPDGFGRGMLFDLEPVSGGSLYPTLESQSTVLGYGVRLKSYFGVLTANPRNVASIVNIDISDPDPDNWDLPTQNQLDDLISAVRGTQGGSTMLLMHPKVMNALNEYKAARLQTVVETTNFNRTFQAWNGIPMVTSYNFLRGTEANVVVP